MIILDTNVVSELMKGTPNSVVANWLGDQPASGVFITAITEADLRYGVAILPAGRRRKSLADALEAMLSNDFADRILPFDRASAGAYAVIAAARRLAGHPVSQFDAQIAAIVRSHGATLATRNTSDFGGCGIQIINPWEA